METDPIVQQHGSLFTSDGESIQANQVAIAAKFSRDHKVRFDQELGEFLIYNAPLEGVTKVVELYREKG